MTSEPSAVPALPDHLVLADRAAWRAWLDANEETSDGGFVLLAKKGTVSPTSLSYAEALEEALCSGWIDGQRKGADDTTFLQRFTPRRPRSLWSSRNLGLVAELIEQSRMRPRGYAEIEKAKADGRWERAYAGQASVVVPDDLAEALARIPRAAEAFAGLTGSERYAVLHTVITAPNPATRANRVARQVEILRGAATAD